MYTPNQKLETANFNFNKSSFISLFVITAISCTILGIGNIISGAKLLSLFLFGFTFLNIYIALYLYEINQKSGKSLDFFFNILYFFASFFFHIYVVLGYIYGIQLKNSQKIYNISLGITQILFTTRLFKSKGLSYFFACLYSVNVVCFTYLYYYLYGFAKFVTYFDSVDVANTNFIILTIFSITYFKNTYYDLYNKALWENEFMNEKFNNMFKKLITPIIKIDKGNFNIEFNDNFILFLKKILGNNEDLNGFLDISEDVIEYFKKETKVTEDYIQFFNNLSIRNESSSGTNSSKLKDRFNKLDLLETSEFKINIFYKRLYYLNKIFKYFKSEKIQKSSISSPKKPLIFNPNCKNKLNLFDIIFSDFNNFKEEEEYYNKIGNFFKNSDINTSSSNNKTNNNSTATITFDMLFKKSKIFGVEFIDILFYN